MPRHVDPHSGGSDFLASAGFLVSLHEAEM